ncbi:MAG: GNAT family N-acetyltransferase [Bacteroidales bacterium]|nr:GNAT family N-acetyltransferase [Bacteroidales bacterium]MDD3989209.1 GNAT family N-acetyltransferase [Bacteroidales bacterium]
MSYLTDPLNSCQNKEGFTCGKDLLDNYFKYQAGQDVRRNLSACFVLTDKRTKKVAGYYTLSGSNISQTSIPESFSKRLPESYSAIPVILLGRLAVDISFQSAGLGKILLVDALKRSLDVSAAVGAFAVVADPLDDSAKEFYSRFGFIWLPDSGKMFLPMKTIKELFKR